MDFRDWSFQIDGTTPDFKDTLNILVTGSASSKANCFKTRGGILSEPDALKGLSARNF